MTVNKFLSKPGMFKSDQNIQERINQNKEAITGDIRSVTD